MKRWIYPWLGGSAILGVAVGFFVSQSLCLLSEFPNTMLLKSAMLELNRNRSSAMPSTLLDLYEMQIHRQNVWYSFAKLDWNQELIQLALLRYVVYSDANQQDAAEKSLSRAASLRLGRQPTREDIEFEREVARRVFGR